MTDSLSKELIARNPCELIEFNRPQPAERKSLSAQDAAKLYSKTLNADQNGFTIALLLLVSTGMRRGEALGLVWRHVDFENSAVFIANQYATDKQLRPPKSKESRRWLSISSEVAATLAKWKKRQEKAFEYIGAEQSGDTLVASNESGGFLDPNNFNRWFRNFSVDNGFGIFTKDVTTSTQNGRTLTRGKGYEGL